MFNLYRRIFEKKNEKNEDSLEEELTKKEEKKDIVRYCDPNIVCNDRHDGVCRRSPEILFISDKVYHVRDSRDPSNGEYLDKNPSFTPSKSVRICPFSNPSDSLDEKVRETDEQTEPLQNPDKLMGRIIRAGLRTTPGKVLITAYVCIAAIGISRIIDNYTPITPQIDQYCQNRYQDVQNVMESIEPYFEPFKEFVETNLNS